MQGESCEQHNNPRIQHDMELWLKVMRWEDDERKWTY